jgi:hypothetical protein
MTKRLVGLLAMIFAGGCATNTETLVILQNQIPSFDQGSCVIPATPTTAFRQSGKLDLSVYELATGVTLPGYLLFPVVQNNLSSSARGTTVQVDTTQLQIEVNRADVVLEYLGGARIAAFSVPVYKVLPGGSTVSMYLEVIRPEDLTRLKDQDWVMARVTVVGNRSGDEIKSNEMRYPIEICSGCLVDNAGSCYSFTGQAAYFGCNRAQDELISCCQLGSQLECPAAKASQDDASVPQDAALPDA